MTTARRQMLRLFYDGLIAAINEVAPNWVALPDEDRRLALRQARAVAAARVVNTNGLTMRRFNDCWAMARRARIYDVPLELAEKATPQQLQEARTYVLEQMGGVSGDMQTKMVAAVRVIAEQRARVIADLKLKHGIGSRSAPTANAKPAK